LETLLLQSAALNDCKKYLEQAGLNDDSILVLERKVSDDQLKVICKDSPASELPGLVLFYRAIDGKTPLREVVAHLQLKPLDWMPILHLLISCRLIHLKHKDKKNLESVAAKTIDYDLVRQEEKTLTRPDTGLYAFPMFVRALIRELDRNHVSGSVFSIVVLSVTSEKSNQQSELAGPPPAAIKSASAGNRRAHSNSPLATTLQMKDEEKGVKILPEAERLKLIGQKFRSIASSYDMIAHYDAGDLALLLPYRSDEQARAFCEEFLTLIAGSSNDKLAHHFGIAAAPADSAELEDLLALVERATRHCKDQELTTCTCRDIRWEEHKTRAEDALAQKDLPMAESEWFAATCEAERFSDRDPRLMTSLEALSNLYQHKREFDKAGAALTSLLQQKEKFYGESSIQIATVAGQLANCHFRLQDFATAESLLIRVLDIYRKTRGPEHPAVANTLCYLASALKSQGRLLDARNAYERAYGLRVKALGANHPDAMLVQKLLDEVVV